MRRYYKILLITLLILFSWLGMQFVHETGHIISAVLSGGLVEKVKLNPLEFSQTVLSVNPQPLIVAAGGPVLGAVIPLLLYLFVYLADSAGKHIFKFFAGFCLVANGLYLGIGGFINVGDAFDIVRYGIPLYALCIFGAVSISAGLYLWHNEGKNFHLGKDKASS